VTTPTFHVIRCLLCYGHSAAVDDGDPLDGIMAAAAEHVREQHPGAGTDVLEAEPGRPAAGWDTHPGSPATWFNGWRGSTFPSVS
jgi:hypothetical protein